MHVKRKIYIFEKLLIFLYFVKKHENYLTIFFKRALILVCRFHFSRKILYVLLARERIGSFLDKPALNGSFVTTDDALCRKNYLYYAETARAARLKL